MPENKSHNNHESAPSRVLSSVNEEERDSINRLWETLGQADRVSDRITEEEVENDLEDVHIRLGFSGRGDRIAGHIKTYGRYAAAAIALIIAGAVFLMLPQIVKIPAGEMATVTLPDGSVVELNSGSFIQFNRLFGYTNRAVSLNGEGFFDVVSADTPFRITSNGTVTEVVGTRFNIRSWSDHPEKETLITVEEGVVRFYPLTHIENSVQLSEQRQSRWQPGFESPTDPASADLERVTGWRERKFIFYEESLQQIFREVERRFDLNITLEKSSVADETLTGYYGEITNPESLLDDICTVAGLRYSKTADGYRIY